jgi:magnesium chelatase family protein
MIIVGLPDTAVQENHERVQMAIKNAGLIFPCKKITVNLAPASVCKEGPVYDLFITGCSPWMSCPNSGKMPWK